LIQKIHNKMINKALIFALLLSGLTLSGQEGKYFFTRSGHIEYTLGGNWSGTKSVWFDDYGMLVHTLTQSTTTISLAGITTKNTEKKLEIRRGKEIWVIDLLSKTGTKTDIGCQTESGRSMTLGKSDEELHHMEREVITGMGATITGYETFLGKKCLMFIWGTTRFSQYKGIPLKSEIAQSGILSMLETATVFEENITIPTSKFEVPGDIEFQEGVGIQDLLNEIEGSGKIQKGNDSGMPPGITFGRFHEATKNLSIPGFPYFMSDDSEGIYLTSFAKSETEQIIIFMENESRFYELAGGGEGMTVENSFSLDGHDAAYIRITQEDDGTPVNSRSLVVRLPEYKAVMYMITTDPMTQSGIEALFRQIRL